MANRKDILTQAVKEAQELAALHNNNRSRTVFPGYGPEYDSPELATERRIRPEETGSSEYSVPPGGDIFTFGVILAEKLTGKLPAASGTAVRKGAPWEYALAVEEGSFCWDISTGDKDLDSLLSRMLSPSPAKRPDASSAAEELRKAAEKESGGSAGTPAPGPVIPKPAPAEADLWPGDDWEWDKEAVRAAGLEFIRKEVRFGKQGYLFNQSGGGERFLTSSKCRMMNLVK